MSVFQLKDGRVTDGREYFPCWWTGSTTTPTKKQTAPKEDLDWRVYMPMGEHSWMA